MVNAKLCLMAALLFLSGCTMHNVPRVNSFTAVADRPNAAQVFLDINGTFYPTDWQSRIGEKPIQRHRSLLNATYHMANKDALRAYVAADEQRQLQEISKLVAAKSRVFILVHGFNDSYDEARESFEAAAQKLPLSPQDALIHVYWDGQIGKGLIGAGIIWFSAVGNSQLVGLRGVRKILNQVAGKDVILISHSRGASVVLSALENPPFAPGFARKITQLDFARLTEFRRPPELEPRGNRIKLIMLAPAIGNPDFWALECEARAAGPKRQRCAGPRLTGTGDGSSVRCPDYRSFTPQLKSLRFTVNRGDRTLKKYIGNLSRWFNATDLGFTPATGNAIAKCYQFDMIPYKIDKEHEHDFELYTRDPEFSRMLTDALGEK